MARIFTEPKGKKKGNVRGYRGLLVWAVPSHATTTDPDGDGDTDSPGGAGDSDGDAPAS